jgi:hypothetical protein
MTYADEWKAISSRIRGLMQAGELHARFLGIRASDSYGRSRKLREQCEDVLSVLDAYRTTYKHSLPAAAAAGIKSFIDTHAGMIRDTSGAGDSLDERVWAALVLFGGVESEISFLLADQQEVIHSRSERAFAHLQRSIVADREFREKWQRAFEDGEVACERLGGTHLLLHGIFAFKVNAEGERTDLVFQDIVGSLSGEQRFVDGIVLTEWKIARSDEETAKQFAGAKAQANRYAAGALGGSELTGYRYLVVVSGPQVRVPDDVIEGQVRYRHTNIAVQPRTPSERLM